MIGRAQSSDLRERVLKASQEGHSARQAATRFGVSASSAIRWIARAGQGETRLRKPGRKSTSLLDPYEEFVRALIKEKKDITLDEGGHLAEYRDMKISRSMQSKWACRAA
ncbi:Transposase [Labrenzia sp. THAF82]|uniref:helix-turn-helix domain-containing protein n=1 Tax=Labrenzia sp. THAF82 TaxID=2587861 RepID=UPI0012A7F53A|nr:Transposase [Labrenzia sp. THAF82]